MIFSKHAAGVAVALFTLTAGSIAIAAAQSDSGYKCLLSHAPFDVDRAVTVCTARSPEALAGLRAANCDPATKSDAAMRVRCAAINSEASGPAAAG